jgi:hypothetical protein
VSLDTTSGTKGMPVWDGVFLTVYGVGSRQCRKD